jgi:hypothetical protein
MERELIIKRTCAGRQASRTGALEIRAWAMIDEEMKQ